MDGRLTIHALGDLVITLDGHVAEMGSRRELALAFYLVYTGQACPRLALADLIWPDGIPAQSRTNLRRSLSNLRRHLPGLLVIDRDHVQVDPDHPVWLDVHEFEACVSQLDPSATGSLEQAVALYRGDFLAHFGIDSQPFQDWVLLEQERLRLLAIDALDALVRHHEALGAHAAGLKYASQLCQMDDLREPSQRHLMRLLYQSGNRSAALAQYETYSRVLQAELGVPPEVETQALYKKIQGDGMLPASIEHMPPVRPQLPARRQAFIGRRAEVEGLAGQLANDPHCRLLTLTGIGGVGKTRLALEVAHQVVSSFRDGVIWLDLTAIQTLEAGLNAIASALGLQFQPGGLPLEEQLLAHMQGRQLLLVLDNYEHLIDILTPMVGRLLDQTPRVGVLVTSRQALNVGWEWLHQVEGLAVPTDWWEAEAAAYDAVQLFAHRARRVCPDFEVPAHLECIVRICRQVGGLPLGIELAAGWLRLMPCDEVARELMSLENTALDVPSRHRSLGALVADTWQRLSAGEQQVLSRLSVFEGGFRREAAAAVAGASVALLAALVNRSLLQVDHQTGRYGIHLVLKDFAVARLTENSQAHHRIHARHGAYYAAWLHELEPALQGPRRTAILNQMEAEIDNLRAAWAWAIEHCEIEAIGQAAEGLSAFYEARNWYHEAIQAFSRAADLMLALPETPDRILLQISLLVKLANRLVAIEGYGSSRVGEVCQRARALCARAEQTPELIAVLHFLSSYYGTCTDYETARGLAAQALELTEDSADPDLMIVLHFNTEFLDLFMGRFEDTLRHSNYILDHYLPDRHYLAFTLSSGDPSLVSLGRLSMVLWYQGFPDRALQRARQVIDKAAQLQHPHSTVFAYAFILPVFCWCGEWDALRESAHLSLSICREQDLSYFLGNAMVYQALSGLPEGRLDEAISSLGEAVTVWRSTGGEAAVPTYLNFLAELHWRAGEIAAGLSVIEDVLGRIARSGERMTEAETYRLQGELLAPGDEAAAEAAFEHAVAVAQRQHARSWELRATMSLARLWQHQGRGDEARARLQAVYDGFTEGFGTADLREAGALLGRLSAG